MMFFSTNVIAKTNNYKDTIIVGVYDSSPYYEVDADGSVGGYYHELLTLLQTQYEFDYEYVICDFSEGYTKLKEGKIDIMLGLSVTSERLKEIIYNQQPIATEVLALFTMNDNWATVNEINGAKVGLVGGTESSKIVMNYFSSTGLKVNPIIVGSWTKLEQKLTEGELDVILHNSYIQETGYNKIYEFTGDQVYIGANNNNREILEKLDQAIIELRNQKNDPIGELYGQYFGTIENTKSKQRILGNVLPTVLIFGVIFYMVPKWKQKKVQAKIRLNMRNNNYLLQYQPIYNPRNRSVVGFEGLLRLQGEGKEMIPPSQFLADIEKNNMLFEVSLWILERAIYEYHEIKQYDCVKEKEFYLSVNVSLNEIENKKFVHLASELLAKSGLEPNSICLEIIERIKVKDVSKVTQNIMRLKQAGFKIAIDDFGTEYSNLDLLLNLDTNIIKIDRCFVEGIHRDSVKYEVISFVSRIAEVKKKHIILEGIEEEAEATTIKDMEQDLLFVQGYYYSKPLFKEDIKTIQC